MARLRDNVIAGYVGHAWVALMGLAFVPAYLHALGPDAYGIVGFMLSLQALSLLLDLGANVHVSREIAQRSTLANPGPGLGRLLRSFESLAWSIALVLGLGLAFASAPLADGWLQPGAIPRADLVQALVLCAAVVAASWPGSLYSAALVGMEQQPRLNALVVVFSTLRYAGVLPLLWFTDTGLSGFLLWQAAAALAQTLATAWLAWLSLPPGARPASPHWDEIGGGLRFAMGAFAALSLGLVFSQLDKLVVSRMLPLADLGVYAVAAAIGAGLGRLVMPVFSATYPRFGRLLAAGDEAACTELFRLAGQLVAVLTGAAAAVACVFGQYLLHLWTGDAALAERLHVPLALLMLGAHANALLSVPFALQLATGVTRPALVLNLVLVIASLPAFVIATRSQGLAGTAAVWALANLAALPTMAWLMRRHLPRGETVRWMWRGVLMPGLGSAIPMWLVLAFGQLWPGLPMFPVLLVACSASFVCAVMFAPDLRAWVIASLLSRSVPWGT